MKEYYKEIPNFESYQISTYGNVKSFKFGKERFLKFFMRGKNYHSVELYNDDHIDGKLMYLHQLMCMTFLDHNPSGHRFVIDHINENKLDNKLENLQIVTNRFNVCKSQGEHSSIYKGVSITPNKKKWISQIYINGKVKYLGTFTDEIDASEAYQNELNKL